MVETAKLALWLGADRLGCLLARVYYREVKEAIPMGVQEQARPGVPGYDHTTAIATRKVRTT